MSYENSVSAHYTHGELLETIIDSLDRMGKTIANITIEDLAPVDEFHIGGRAATDNLLDQLNFSEQDHVLDVGCGLGGAARYIAKKLNNSVTGIDLTEEYIKAGQALCTWVGMDKKVTLHKGSALSMPFDDESFDGAVMLHVGMNIDDKARLFTEVHRVLRPGATFGIYDVMRNNDGELAYPVPWAAEYRTSKLATPDQYKTALNHAGFRVHTENSRREFALDFFQKVRARTEAEGGPAPLGLHTLMQESTAVKVKNMIENISSDLVTPVEIIAEKT